MGLQEVEGELAELRSEVGELRARLDGLEGLVRAAAAVLGTAGPATCDEERYDGPAFAALPGS